MKCLSSAGRDARDRKTRRPLRFTGVTPFASRVIAALCAAACLVGGPVIGADAESADRAAPMDRATLTGATTAPPRTDVSVLWILLDEAPLWPLLRTDGSINARRFPGFASLAGASTWYRDTLSTAQWTYFAVPSILEGRYPTFTGDPTFKDRPNNLFTALAGSKAMDVREVVTTMCPRSACTNVMTNYKQMSVVDQVEMLEGTIARSASARKPTLHFVHVALPHRPWNLTPDMRVAASPPPTERSADPVDRKRDSYQWHMRQYLATDSIIGSMVQKLKSSANWDRTMVIVTADHGLTFSPGESIRDRINTANPGSMDDVFRVPLFIKYPNQSRGTISDCTVSTVDLLPTVLAATGTRARWKMDGVDLGSQCPRRNSRPVRWPNGKAELRSTFADALKRVTFYNSWIAANGNTDDIYRVGLSGSLIGTRVPATATIDTSITWTLQNPDAFRVPKVARFSRVPALTTGFVTASRPIDRREEGLIVINGTIVAVAAELAGRPSSAKPGFFWSVPNTRFIGAGNHRVELWTATWRGSKPTLRRVGPPQN